MTPRDLGKTSGQTRQGKEDKTDKGCKDCEGDCTKCSKKKGMKRRTPYADGFPLEYADLAI